MTKPASACIFLTASSPPVTGGEPGQPEHHSTRTPTNINMIAIYQV